MRNIDSDELLRVQDHSLELRSICRFCNRSSHFESSIEAMKRGSKGAAIPDVSVRTLKGFTIRNKAFVQRPEINLAACP